MRSSFSFFFQAEDGIRYSSVTGVQTCALPICFASYSNTKLPRFYSRFYSPNTLGVDALSHSWEGENCWLVSPVSLITQVIEHLKLCKCVGVLVVPYWPSALFCGHALLMKIVLSVVILLASFMLLKGGEFVHGSNRNSIFGSDKFSSPVLFLRIKEAS